MRTTLALIIWLKLIDIAVGLQIFNNTNNMFGNLNESGANTSYILSLGKYNTVSECEQAFNDYSKNNQGLKARSFIYYTTKFDESYARYCYVRTDTWWSPTDENEVISGQIDNFYDCYSNFDCELNGECNQQTKKCDCKPAWTGQFCQYPNFKWGSKNLGYQRPSYSQWGGDARYDANINKWILYVAEMYDQCGINACCCGNSQIVRAYSDGDKPGGPYTYDRVVVPYFSHEPHLGYDPVSKTYVLWHWGNGVKSEANTVSDCKNGVTGSNAPGCENIGDAMYNYISFSNDLNAEPEIWQQNIIKVPGQNHSLYTDLCPSNPLIFPDGSLLSFWTDRTWAPSYDSVEKLMTSSYWNETYIMHTENLWISNISDGTALEDPYIWYDEKDKTYHALFHGMIPGPEVFDWLQASEGRHAFSADGKNWILSPHYTFNTTVCYTDAPCDTFIRRERPHLILDPNNGEPTHLTSAFTVSRSNDKSLFYAVPLYTSKDYCEQGKLQYCGLQEH